MLWQNVIVDSLELIPNFAFPNWRIIFRSDNGSIVSNDIVDGDDIVSRLKNGLQWEPDLTSENNNATNSKLLVGPVNMTYARTISRLNGLKSLISSVETMTVIGKAVNIRK